jgi:hypothetical protein
MHNRHHNPQVITKTEDSIFHLHHTRIIFFQTNRLHRITIGVVEDQVTMQLSHWIRPKPVVTNNSKLKIIQLLLLSQQEIPHSILKLGVLAQVYTLDSIFRWHTSKDCTPNQLFSKWWTQRLIKKDSDPLLGPTTSLSHLGLHQRFMPKKEVLLIKLP